MSAIKFMDIVGTATAIGGIRYLSSMYLIAYTIIYSVHHGELKTILHIEYETARRSARHSPQLMRVLKDYDHIDGSIYYRGRMRRSMCRC